MSYATSFLGPNKAVIKDIMGRIRKRSAALTQTISMLRVDGGEDLADLAEYDATALARGQELLDEHEARDLECLEFNKKAMELKAFCDRFHRSTDDAIPSPPNLDDDVRQIALRAFACISSDPSLPLEMLRCGGAELEAKIDEAIATREEGASQVVYEENLKTAAEVTELRSQVSDLTSKLGAASALARERNLRQNRAEASFQKSEQERIELTESVRRLKSEARRWDTLVKSKQSRGQDLQDQNDELSRRKAQLEQENTNLRAQVQSLQGQPGDREQREAQLSEAQTNLRKALEYAEETNKLQTQVTSLYNQIDEKDQKISELSYEVSEEKKRVGRREVTISNWSKRVNESLVPEYEQRITELTAKTRDFGSLVAREVKLTDDLGKVGHQLRQAKTALDAKSRGLDELRGQYNSLSAHWTTIWQEKTDLEASMDEARARETELETLLDKVRAQKTEVESRSSILDEALGESKNTSRSFEATLSNYKSCLTVLLDGLTEIRPAPDRWDILVRSMSSYRVPAIDGVPLKPGLWKMCDSWIDRGIPSGNAYAACIELCLWLGQRRAFGVETFDRVRGMYLSLLKCRTFHRGLIDALVRTIMSAAYDGRFNSMLGIMVWQLVELLDSKWPHVVTLHVDVIFRTLKGHLGAREARILDAFRGGLDGLTNFCRDDGLSAPVGLRDGGYLILLPDMKMILHVGPWTHHFRWISFDQVDLSDMFEKVRIFTPEGREPQEILMEPTPEMHAVLFKHVSGV